MKIFIWIILSASFLPVFGQKEYKIEFSGNLVEKREFEVYQLIYFDSVANEEKVIPRLERNKYLFSEELLQLIEKNKGIRFYFDTYRFRFLLSIDDFTILNCNNVHFHIFRPENKRKEYIYQYHTCRSSSLGYSIGPEKIIQKW